MPKTPEEMEAAMVANMKAKTGKTMPQWLKITKATKLAKHGEIVKFLKAEHEMTHGFANLVAHYTLRAAKGSDAVASTGGRQGLVDRQYSGKKAELRPIYDALIAAVTKFGGDVEVSPKKTYVSLRRSKQFALIQPSTATRIDVGINLKGEETTARMEASGSFNAMVSHRVRVSSKKEVDAELKRWLKQAYERA